LVQPAILPRSSFSRPSHTKIVATIGPASSDPETLKRLISAGVDVFRLNSAHATPEQCSEKLEQIRTAAEACNLPVAVLLDLAGPKLRLGQLPNDQVYCPPGGRVRFVPGEIAQGPDELVSTYPHLLDELSPGDRVLLADGTVSLLVEESHKTQVICRVVQPGAVRSRQGINLPGVRLRVRALTEDDRRYVDWAAQNSVDFVGLSFVRSAEEIRELKALLQTRGSLAHVVAKIEKAEALENLEAIVEAADAVMVARGDLGVETDIAQLGVVQKRIVATCRRLGRPVIVATQMLDSMQQQVLPTRAEVADVANAILDGADACMLSGETAIGQHPVEAVEMMHRIALATEAFAASEGRQAAFENLPTPRSISEAIISAAARLARMLEAKLIAAGTSTGRTAFLLSRYRVGIPIVGITDNPVTLRRMCLYWGVIPVLGPRSSDPDSWLGFVVDWGSKAGILGRGDIVVLVWGTGLQTAAQNAILVHQVQ
jgi:pyruvate kinase